MDHTDCKIHSIQAASASVATSVCGGNEKPFSATHRRYFFLSLYTYVDGDIIQTWGQCERVLGGATLSSSMEISNVGFATFERYKLLDSVMVSVTYQRLMSSSRKESNRGCSFNVAHSPTFRNSLPHVVRVGREKTTSL